MANCSCDPLKRILCTVLREVVQLKGNDEIVKKLHLFYRSSVIRPTIPGRREGDKSQLKLQCRIGDDTLKALREWVEENGRIVSSVLDDKLTNCENVKSVNQDKFGNLTVELDKEGMKEQVISWTVTKGWTGYSEIRCHNQMYRAEIAMTPLSSSDCFMDYRKILVAQAVTTTLRKIGHQIDDSHFAAISGTRNLSSNVLKNTVFVAGVPVIDMAEQEDKTDQFPEVVLRADLGSVTADQPGVQDILSNRLLQVKEISEARRLEGLRLSSWVTSLDNLTRATLHYDLLYRPLEAEIHLGSLSESGQINHSALFIMYNYSRILSILHKFTEQVESEEYPQLPELDKVDFTHVCEREEEVHLLQLVMEWPRVMESAVNFARFQLNVVIICKFLLTLAKAFNSFYFQIVVLVPQNASHNFPAMMARVYLIKAICSVFEDCLDILQINHANLLSIGH